MPSFCFRCMCLAISIALVGCGPSETTESKYRKAAETVAAEQAHLDGLRADLQRVIKKVDDHHRFRMLSNQFAADDDKMEIIESRMNVPFSAEYLAMRAEAKRDRETMTRMLTARAQKLALVGKEYEAAEAAVAAQEQRVIDAVALRNKYAPDPAAVANDPVAVEARRLHDAAALYDRTALPLSGAEVLAAMKKRGYEFEAVKNGEVTIHSFTEGSLGITFGDNLGKTRGLNISVNTNHTNAALRERTMELTYAVGAALLELSDEKAKEVIGKAISESSNFLSTGFNDNIVYGYSGKSVIMYADPTKSGYRLYFVPRLITK